jgi:hypothetical protein
MEDLMVNMAAFDKAWARAKVIAALIGYYERGENFGIEANSNNNLIIIMDSHGSLNKALWLMEVGFHYQKSLRHKLKTNPDYLMAMAMAVAAPTNLLQAGFSISAEDIMQSIIEDNWRLRESGKYSNISIRKEANKRRLFEFMEMI